MNAYTATINQLNQQMAALNSLLNQLEALETQAGEGGALTGTVSTSSVQSETTAAGIDLANPANATQIGIAATDVNNEITTLSAQENQTMDELQMLSSDSNSESQAVAPVVASAG
jgi:prefoldin subunit 5